MNKLHLLGTAGLAVVLVAGTATACPNCAQAVAMAQEGQSGNAPAGFQYSIYFMLAMPFVLAGGFGAYLHHHLKREGSEPIPGDEPQS